MALESKAIIDETYKNRPLRLYGDYSPTIRAERSGLLVLEAKKWAREQQTKDLKS